MGYCEYPTCYKHTSSERRFCSVRHRDMAPAAGLSTLVELSEDDDRYMENTPFFHSVEYQFDSHWLHTDESPGIYHIYEINPAEDLECAYLAYRQEVEWEGDFESQGLDEGNERLRFHGTKRACDVGDFGSIKLCSNSSCSLCSIIRGSFKMSRCGNNAKWAGKATGRFGRGIYTTATSSKAGDTTYTKNLSPSPFSAMLLNKVVVGKGKKMRKNDPDMTGPPKGFHSVIGEPDENSVLNYDELVVYDERAIIPAYLIIYAPSD